MEEVATGGGGVAPVDEGVKPKRLAQKRRTAPDPATSGGEGLARVDHGEVNKRILARETLRADYRRVEGAGVPRKTRLFSRPAKSAFARFFGITQQFIYYISDIGRIKLASEVIEAVEADVKKALEEADDSVSKQIDKAWALLKHTGIDESGIASYLVEPLELDVKITSPLSRRFFELIHKVDQLAPLLETLEIEELLTPKQARVEASRSSKVIRQIAGKVRTYQVKVRKMAEEVAAEAAAAEVPISGDGSPAHLEADGAMSAGAGHSGEVVVETHAAASHALEPVVDTEHAEDGELSVQAAA